MNGRIAFPFVVLPDEAVRFEGWLIGDPGQPLHPAGRVLEHWDYARDLEVSAAVSLDWDAISTSLQLPIHGLSLTLALIAGTGSGTLPRRQDRLCDVVLDVSSEESRLAGVLTGRTLSGRLRLSLQILLNSPVDAGTPLSPKVRGARLWQSHHEILIEDGGASRFPVETISFVQAFGGKPQEKAPWYLHWRPGTLDCDFSACVRLYVNSDYPEVLARFVAGDGITLQAIMADVVSQMVETVLQEEDAGEVLAGCDEGSVGRQIRRWLDHSFPGQELSTVKATHQHNPGTFRAAILAAAELGGVAN